MTRQAVVPRFSIVLLLVGLLGAAVAPGALASGWSIQKTPNPTGATTSVLLGAACTSRGVCTAVGYDFKGDTGVTLAERWNGSKWSIQKTPNPTGAKTSELFSVACTSKSDCIAVGEYCKSTTCATLAERWNGTKWLIRKTPNPAGATRSLLNGVACPSESDCTAVGEHSNGSATVTLAERWNGTKWSIRHTPNPTGAADSDLSGVSCTSKSICTAVGQDSDNFTKWVTLAERWNGTKWSIQHIANPTGAASTLLHGVACTSKSACIAVGDSFSDTVTVTRAERWNGSKWSIQKTPNPTGGTITVLYGVFCTSRRVCTAVGDSYDGRVTVTLAERWKS